MSGDPAIVRKDSKPVPRDRGKGMARSLRAISANELVEAPMLVEHARKSLAEAISGFERAEREYGAWKADVDACRLGEAEMSYHHTENRRIARGILSVSGFPKIIILLSDDPADQTAKKALEIISVHGVSDEIRMAAGVLLREP